MHTDMHDLAVPARSWILLTTISAFDLRFPDLIFTYRRWGSTKLNNPQSRNPGPHPPLLLASDSETFQRLNRSIKTDHGWVPISFGYHAKNFSGDC